MALPSVPAPSGGISRPQPSVVTLRSLLDARRAEGRRMSIEEGIAVIVPLCMELQERHRRGERVLLHPSAIAPGPDGVAHYDARIAGFPQSTFDRHCIAPELQRSLEPGDACASVYALGAMLYEMVTGQHVGPGMKRPREIDPNLPEAVEILIGKAIIGDRSHRPADLGALASAMYHLAPEKSVHPPDVSASTLDESAELSVDVRFSMLPPSEIVLQPQANGKSRVQVHLLATRAVRPSAATVTHRASVPSPIPNRPNDGIVTRLATLKARLESDPRPRYVVNKDRMDHGPFNAVELLQQIASHAFDGGDGLRDEIGGQQMPISDWEEFAPFAEQAMLLREKRAEEKAVVTAVNADQKRGLVTLLIAASVVSALAGILAVWFFTRRGVRNEDVVVTEDRGGALDVNGDVKGHRRRARPGVGAVGPGYSGGRSYEAVLNSNNETITMGGDQGAPDLTNAQLSAPLRSASFIPGCGAPDDMKVTVRVAVRMGVPIGVTVTTQPSSQGVAGCIDRAVRGLRWAPSAKTDFVTTSY
jgi:eukaryotic-like serine/threonine-protein kinase